MESKHLEGVYAVTKTYFVNKTYPDFHIILAYVINYRFQYLNNVVVGYNSDGQEHDITLAPDGNADNNLGYTKKKPSVVKQIKKRADCLSKAESLENPSIAMVVRVKSLWNSTCQSIKFREYCSQSAARKKMTLLYLCHGPSKTVTSARKYKYKRYPEPFVVIAPDQQLTDIQIRDRD